MPKAEPSDGERNGLDERLPHEPRTGGAECGANGEFGLPSGGARQQQVGEIHAANQEKHADRGEQQPDCRTHRFGDVAKQRLDVDAEVAVRLGIFVRKIGGDGVHLRARLLDPDARTETGDGYVAEIRTIADFLGRVVQRFPQFVIVAGIVKFGWHDSDDFSVAAVQADFAIEDACVTAETPLPQRIAQHGDGGRALRIELLGFREGAADQRRDPESVKQAGGSACAADALRLALTGQIEIGDKPGEGEIGEDLLTATPIEVIGSAGRGLGHDRVWQASGKRDETVGGRIREGRG